MVNTLQAERDALAQELHRARQASTEDDQPVAKKQAVARQVNSCQEVHGLVPVIDPQAILAQGEVQGGVASARSPVCFGVVRFLLHPRQTSMRRRGWQAIEVP